MAVTITLKTLQQQTFKIRMEPDETVRARLEPGMGVTGSEGGMGAGRQRSRREGREDGAVRAGFTPPNLLDFLGSFWPPSPGGLRQPLVAGAALTVWSPDQAPPPGSLPGPGSNVSALAGRGRLARMPGWAPFPGTGALGSQLCGRLLWTLVAESGSSGQ